MSDQLIDKILDKRLSGDGSQQFLIQYKNSDKTDEEWKTAEDIQGFEQLLEEFNREQNNKTTNGLTNGTDGLTNGTHCLTNGTDVLQNGVNHLVNGSEEEEVETTGKSADKPNGFDRGFRPFKILGAKNDDKNGLMFLVMFREDMTTADLIPNHILHQKCPQLLIKFYEKNTLWKRY